MLIICPECGKEISDQSDTCIHCGYPLSKIKTSTVIVNNKEYDFTDIILDIESEEYNPAVYIRKISEICSIPIYEAKEIYFKLKNEKAVSQPIICEIKTQDVSIPKCPTCGSTNIEKIGGIERGASVAMWGLFSKKINKTFKCKNCGYTW